MKLTSKFSPLRYLTPIFIFCDGLLRLSLQFWPGGFLRSGKYAYWRLLMTFT